MKITATKIAQWAKTKKAQVALPKLIRRLLHTAAKPIEADFPAGDSTALPGWDGELGSESGSPWIPKGTSYWEFSCEAKVTRKANKDYEKRTKSSSTAKAHEKRLLGNCDNEHNGSSQNSMPFVQIVLTNQWPSYALR